jgi:DNA polymerase alpha subunit A
MMDDDFIEDDDGSGYVDDGRNEWERSGGEDSAEESETEADYYERTGKKKPKKRKGGKKGDAGADKSASSLTHAFARQPAQSRLGQGISASSSARKAAEERSTAAMEAYRPKVSREKEEDFMKRLMGGLASSPSALGGASAAPQTPSPAPALRGYPGRASGYNLATSSTTPTYASRKRPLPLGGGNAPSVTYRTDKRHQYPSSPSEDTSAPSSDLPDPSSDGPGAPVHISGSDTPPWESRGGRRGDVDDDGFDFGNDDFGLADVPHKKLRSTATMTPTARGVTGQIGSMGLQGEAASRPKALRMQMGGPSDEDEDDEDLAVQAPKATSALGPAKRRMNVSAEAAAPPRPTALKQSPAVVEAKAAVASPEVTPVGHKNGNAAWQSVHASLSSVNAGTVEASAETDAQAESATGSGVNALNDDKSLPFYWMDHIELEAGIILLIGKVKDRTTGKFVSACLRVEGIERCVFLLIRDKKIADGHATDTTPTEDEILDEFDELREKHGIKNFLSKTVQRHYAFESPGVPATGTYLKVKYGFDEPALPTDICGKTFSQAFGTQTSAMELFLIKRKIMGPCWLRVTSVDTLSLSKPLSWCKAEYSIDDAKFLSPYSDAAKASGDAGADGEGNTGDDSSAPREVPPLTIASLALRTVHNHQANKREIVALSIRTWSDAQLEDIRNPEERPSSVWTAVRPLAGQWPTGFEAEVRKQGNRIKAMRFERQLLNGLLAQIQRLDPDIILTHDFAATDLDVLLARMRELKADHWSKIGRLRRPLWPKLRNGWNLGLMKGRLCCDLGSDVGKSMITSTTWSLTEMVGTHLKIQREDIDPDDVPSYFDAAAPNPKQLLTFLQHCEVDTFFQMSIAHKVQILPLTKQLTNLAGNTWARTLSGGRAERNEYILLHDFHRRKFVVPDKVTSGKRAAAAKAAAAAEAEAEDGAESKGNAGASKKSKKDKFKGGLVFDPKRGLWDRYVLVMDFNSLYPSIIQEYNIDFTTVDRSRWNEVSADAEEDVEGVPDIPSSDVSQGVLPNLIAKLVERRRQVKSLMKDKRAPAHKQLQWNVKQLALKLTANSMYGCLGFEGSRFYARPLAALTTYKGREILTATKELAESLGLDVIYGDTDSVMINTNAMTYAQAARIGSDFKKAVNERYRLLEIDIDAVFERMLLLQKKKYAARKVEEVEVMPSGEEKKKVTTEIKGLDMKRREYSALSKNVSSYVLEQILSGESTENVVASIHGYLTEVGESVRGGQIPLEDFIIFKRLGKDPKAYGTNITGQPHVHVALRMQERGQSARMGDVIPYIFCLAADGTSSSKSAQADKAHHPDELRKQDSELKVDYEHYLALQILPPIERMCDSIQGTDRSRLAECLGLDASRYGISQVASLTSADREFTSLDSQTPDEVRFAKCERLSIKCGRCGETRAFEGLADAKLGGENAMLRPEGLFCPSASCGGTTSLPLASVAIQLQLSIRRHISRYYTSFQVCTEPSCGTRTRLLGVYAKRCLVPNCRGAVSPEYTDKALYDQLCYYSSLFDVESAADKSKGRANEEEVKILCKRNAEALAILSRSSRKYLDKNGRRFVDLGKVFGRGGRRVGA